MSHDPDRFAAWLEAQGFEEHPSRANEWTTDTCPLCGAESSRRLMVNVELGWANCWGGCKFKNPYRLISEIAGISYSSAARLISKTNTLPSSAVRQVVRKAEPPPQVVQPDVDGVVWLSQLSSIPSGGVVTAAAARGFDLAWLLLKGCGIGVAGNVANRLVIPVYWRGYLVWFQAWDWQRQSDIKYMSPAGADGIVGRKHVLYQEDAYARSPGPLIVTEGIFNAWSAEQVGFPAFASFGKALTEFQLATLSRVEADPIIVAYDPDAREQAVGVVQDLAAIGRRAFLPTCSHEE